MAVKFLCDRCGKEIEEKNHGFIETRETRIKFWGFGKPQHPTALWWVCENCYNSYLDWWFCADGERKDGDVDGKS